jgi:hypothetical protein
LLTPQPVRPGYLAVLGRIAPEKGVDRAIRIATRCGIPLKIAAKVDAPTRNITTRSSARGANASELCRIFPPFHEKGVGNAGCRCTRSLACKIKKHTR